MASGIRVLCHRGPLRQSDGILRQVARLADEPTHAGRLAVAGKVERVYNVARRGEQLRRVSDGGVRAVGLGKRIRT